MVLFLFRNDKEKINGEFSKSAKSGAALASTGPLRRFLIFKIDILCQIRDNMATSGITWPYKIEKGQIQKTSSSNQWYPVKFSFSSGDQWVN